MAIERRAAGPSGVELARPVQPPVRGLPQRLGHDAQRRRVELNPLGLGAVQILLPAPPT
jgi:hypothetical protein